MRRWFTHSVLLVATAGISTPLHGQSSQASDQKPPVFEVVSIKRNTGDGRFNVDISDRPDGSLTIRNMPIITLIEKAYPANIPIPITLLPGLPEWAISRTERYDIVAKSSLSRPATPDERMAMVRALQKAT